MPLSYSGEFMPSRWIRAGLVCLSAAVVLATIAFIPSFRSLVRANRLVDLRAVARMYPNFTLEQEMGIRRQVQSQLHPRGRDLSMSELLQRLVRFAKSAPRDSSGNGMPPPANFAGNLTAVTVADTDLMVLAQQADCSLTLRDSAYTFSPTGPVFSYTLAGSTPHYERLLHSQAGLTTTGGTWPAGCGTRAPGAATRKFAALGTTTSGLRVYASHFYDGQDEVFTAVAKGDDTFQDFNILPGTSTVHDLTTADLNGDGNSDLVIINDQPTSGGDVTVSISLGKADGSFPAPTAITLPGSNIYSAVVDDFNGDGKLDIVVSTSQGLGGLVGTTYDLNFLAGNGDGTFQAVQSYPVAPPLNIGVAPYTGLISADLRGTGHKDIVASTGFVFYGDGHGGFLQSATMAFFYSGTALESGPSVVAADFNNDGKIDLATDNGSYIATYLGKGDGTFRLKAAYATVANAGYLNAQDIDGDGNVDLFSGSGNNGTLGGDQNDFNLGYALMGNGDGTFQGAPAGNIYYTGTNLGDLNGDHKVDSVGVGFNGTTIASSLGDGKGNFTPGGALVTSPITLSGTQYTLNGIDSYGLGDLNADGFDDLVYLGTNFYGPNYSPGIFIATSKGDGSFNTPVFVPAPAFIAAPDIDVNPVIAGVRLADMNHDGKLDLVYTYDTTSYTTHANMFGVAVQLGNGDGTFKTTSVLTQLYSGATAPNPGAYQVGMIGDADKDGNEDLFIQSGFSGNSQSFTLQLYPGKGDGSFGSPKTVSGVTPPGTLLGIASPPIALADMNGDGTPDLVAVQMDAGTQNMQIAIALGNGDGTFKAPGLTTYNSQFFVGTGLAVADFDGDGKLDVVTASYIGPSGSGIAYGTGDGGLRTSGSATAGYGPAETIYLGVGGATTALDLNGDGKPDILSGATELLSQTAPATTTPVASTTALTVSAASITVGQQVTFTAAVSGPSGNTTVPTGSVTFKNGTATLGTGTLDGTGKATFSSSALAAGSYSVTAVYGGDANFNGSTSSAVSLTVNVAAPADFSIAFSPASGTTSQTGGSASSTATIAPLNGSTQTVTLICSGAPTNARCGITPGSVTLDGSHSATAALTVTTGVSSMAQRTGTALALLGGGVFLMLGTLRVRRLRSGLAKTLLAVLLSSVALTMGAALSGCGSGSSSTSPPPNNKTPAGTYTITVTAAAGGTSHTASYSLTVQ